MTDKDKIKFAIRYLKKGLKSKRTPPLYEVLMNELGFEKKDKVNNLSCVAEVRLANWQKYKGLFTQAKELIRQLCLMVRELNNPNVQLTNVDCSLSEAEQFISEVEE